MRKPLLLLLALAATSALAQSTYRWVDPATGKTMITDTPPPGKAKPTNKIELSESDAGPQSYALRRASQNFPVTLYTTPDCGDDCQKARDILNQRGVPFSEKLMKTPEQFNELKTLLGETFVPSLKVGSQMSKGVLAENYNKLLDLAGYPTTAPYGSKPIAPPKP